MTQTSTDFMTGRNGRTYRADADGNADGLPMQLLFNYDYIDGLGDRATGSEWASTEVEAAIQAGGRLRGTGYDHASLTMDPNWTHLMYEGVIIDRAVLIAAEREAA